MRWLIFLWSTDQISTFSVSLLFFSANYWIECNTPVGAGVETMLKMVEISFEGGTVIRTNINFTYLENPETDVRPLKNIVRYTCCVYSQNF